MPYNQTLPRGPTQVKAAARIVILVYAYSNLSNLPLARRLNVLNEAKLNGHG